jgi:hypothetical protein
MASEERGMNIGEALAVLNAYPPVRRRIRHANLAFVIAAGEHEAHLAFAGGEVIETTAQPAFAIRMNADAWASFRTPVPPPGRHDFGAMAETGQARIEGEMLELYRFYSVLRDVVTALAGKDLGR